MDTLKFRIVLDGTTLGNMIKDLNKGFTPLSGAVPAKLHYDYFLKDHLGNTRMVLTEEASSETYPALSFEGVAGSAELQNQDRYWENKAGQSINVAGVRTMHSTGTNALLTRKDLGAIGAAKLLKVMSGDKIQTSVQFHYTATNANNSAASGINSLVANITQLIGNSLSPSEVIKSGVSSLGSSLSSQTALAKLLNTANTTSGSNQAPKAYLHVLLFNDQFKFDAVNSKVIPVPYTVNSWGTLSRIGANAVSVKKNGYAYVYFSNESNELVYFDNFNLTHERGPVLEETHYYPFGLTMAGISSRAAGKLENRYKYNGKELNNKEFSDGAGLEMYDFGARNYDPQIGRWHTVDPKADQMRRFSPYNYAFDNPLRFIDPDGMAPTDWVRYRDAEGNKHIDYDPSVTNQASAEAYVKNKGGTDASYAFKEGYQENSYVKDGEKATTHKLTAEGQAIPVSELKPAITKADPANSEPSQATSSGGIDVSKAISEVNNYAGAVAIEAGAIDVALQKGIGAVDDLGKLAKPAGKVLTGIGAITTVISGVQTIQDIRNGDTKAATVHGLDTAVGAAALVAVGTVAAPYVAAAAVVWGVSRLFWGN